MSDWNTIVKQISKGDYDAWGQFLSFREIKGSVAYFNVPTDFLSQWIARNYTKNIIDAFATAGISLEKIDISVKSAKIPDTSISESKISESNASLLSDSHTKITSESKYAPSHVLSSPFSKTDARYTFDNFIVGESNKFAFALAERIAEGPCESCNPLFFYSSVGLGKTHLMQAIANKVKEENKRNVIYLTAEKYTRMCVNAIMGGLNKSIEFKEIFRSVDILMIDDIQFLGYGKKVQTEQELLNTFDELIDAGKQIVFAASKAPSAITGISERLKSRMAGGIVADIMPANFDLRLKILEAKAANEKCRIPHEVLVFLAEKIPSNIRELEGALQRVIAYSKIMNVTPSMTGASEVLKDLLSANEEHIVSINEIKNKVASFYKIKQSDLLSPSREKGIAVPRQIAMYMAKTLTTKSYPEIAKEFNRDHTTVLHGVKKIEALMKSDRNVYEQINMIRGGLT